MPKTKGYNKIVKTKKRSTLEEDLKAAKKETTKHKAYLQMNKKKLDANTRSQAEEIIKRQEARNKRIAVATKAAAELVKKNKTKTKTKRKTR